MSARGLSAVTLAAILALLGGSLGIRMDGLAYKHESEHDRHAAVVAELDRSVVALASLNEQDAALTANIDAAKAMAEARTDFDAKVAEASKALESANGKVDVAGHKQRVMDAQNAVLAAADAETIAAQASAVEAVTAEVAQAVRDYDTERARRTSAGSRTDERGSSSSGSGDGQGAWFAEARAILNSVGGAHLNLIVSSSCMGGYATACSVRGGTIKVSPDFANLSTARKYWAMSHELSHQVHFNHWDALHASGGFHRLFGGNLETLANCMATARGHGAHGQHCSAEMVQWASAAWNADFGG